MATDDCLIRVVRGHASFNAMTRGRSQSVTGSPRLLRANSTMNEDIKRKQCSSIQGVVDNPGQPPQHLSRAHSSRVPPKVIAQAEPRETDRTRPT